MTKPQTAKDLVELYDECLGYVIAQAGYDPAPTVDLETLVDYLRNRHIEVVEEECPFLACDFCQLRTMPSIIVAPAPPLSPLTDEELSDRLTAIMGNLFPEHKWCLEKNVYCSERGIERIVFCPAREATSQLIHLIKENSK